MLIPSIDLMGGSTVQLVGGKEKVLDAGDPRPIAERFAIAGEIAVIDLDAAMGKGSNAALIQELLRIAPCRVGGGIRDADTALKWLNLGATKVILGTAAVPEVLSRLPRERVIAALDAVHGEVVVEGWTTKTGKSVKERILELKPYVGGFLVTFVEREGRMAGVDLKAIEELVEAVGKECRLTVAGGVTTPDDIKAIDKLGADAQVGMALYTGKLDFGDAIAAPLVSDRPDGLFATVVVDEQGVALGMVYSSKESIKQAVATRKGVYYSRSRNSIWVKGDTSGDTQELVRIELDCDRDSLRFVVRQRGAGFCHLKQYSCFSHDRGLGALMRKLQDRMTHAPEGSYTKRLFNNPELLKSKLVEEANELAEAKTKAEVIWEASDVIYFTVVACVKAGITLKDIEDELDFRSLKIERRGGDAKSPNYQPQASSWASTATTSTTPSPAPTQQPSSPISRYLRSDIDQLEMYKPIKPLEELAEQLQVSVGDLVKLDANENLHRPLPEVLQAVASTNFHIYPDPDQNKLRRALAGYLNVSHDMIVGGTGADDLIDVVIRMIMPELIITCPPTFGMYSFLGKISKAKILQVPLTSFPHFELDLNAVLGAIRKANSSELRKAGALIVFVTSPNNPTGKLVPKQAIETLCAENCVVVLDEAYVEFSPAGCSCIDLLEKYPNLIILRTFSKWAALAGFRVGYAVVHKAFAAVMMALKQPYNVSAPGSVAAVTVLSPQVFPKACEVVQSIVKEREVLFALLCKFEWMEPVPSSSNFVLVKITNGVSVQKILDFLRRRAILVRYYNTELLSGFIRISVGTPRETALLRSALEWFQQQFFAAPRMIRSAGPIQAILFDMDGVLADVTDSYRQAIIQAAASFGVLVTADDIADMKAKGNANNDWVVTHRLVTSKGREVDFEKVKAAFEDLYQGSSGSPGLWAHEKMLLDMGLLKTLHAKFPLAIVTGRPRNDASRFLNHFGIQQYFKSVVCMEDAPLKPSPAPVTLALQQLGLANTRSALMVGDTPDDIRAAVGAGVFGVGIRAPSDRQKRNTTADDAFVASGAACVIDDLSDLTLLV